MAIYSDEEDPNIIDWHKHDDNMNKTIPVSNKYSGKESYSYIDNQSNKWEATIYTEDNSNYINVTFNTFSNCLYKLKNIAEEISTTSQDGEYIYINSFEGNYYQFKLKDDGNLIIDVFSYDTSELLFVEEVVDMNKFAITDVEFEDDYIYCDVPKADPFDNEWINVETFVHPQEALQFVKEHYGADDQGRIQILTGNWKIKPDIPNWIQKTDWKLLKKQKLDLVKTIDMLSDSKEQEDMQRKNSLLGILHLIDFMQDWSVDELKLENELVFPSPVKSK